MALGSDRVIRIERSTCVFRLGHIDHILRRLRREQCGLSKERCVGQDEIVAVDIVVEVNVSGGVPAGTSQEPSAHGGIVFAINAPVTSVSLIVGGIGIMNFMLASVTERTREIGIRRALGAEQRHITLQFLVETTVVSRTGGIIRIGLAVGASAALQWLVPKFTGAPFSTQIAA